jgi:hypothetical protein
MPLHHAPRTAASLLSILAAALLSAGTAIAAPVAATVENGTTTTACAEEDNVSMVLAAKAPPHAHRGAATRLPRQDRQRRHGARLLRLQLRRRRPSHRPRASLQEATVVLLDNAEWRIVGMTLPTFWRPQRVPVQVGARSDRGFHLLQVFKKENGKALEAIVLYPFRRLLAPQAAARGRASATAPTARRSCSARSSRPGRPVVNIASIRVVPKPLAIHLRFTNGASAVARVDEISRASAPRSTSPSPSPLRARSPSPCCARCTSRPTTPT